MPSVSLVGSFPCRLKDNATPYLNGMVCEAFVEATQQGDIDCCCDAVLPLGIQMPRAGLCGAMAARVRSVVASPVCRTV